MWAKIPSKSLEVLVGSKKVTVYFNGKKGEKRTFFLKIEKK